jgi:hypothetical protein
MQAVPVVESKPSPLLDTATLAAVLGAMCELHAVPVGPPRRGEPDSRHPFRVHPSLLPGSPGT